MENMIFEEKMTFILDQSRRDYRYQEGERWHIIVKVAYNEAIDFMYTRYCYKSASPLEIKGNLEYAGFVHYPTGRIFDCGLRVFDYLDDSGCIPAETLKGEAQQAIYDEVRRRVGNTPQSVTDEAEPVRDERAEYKQYGADREAREAFFSGIDVIEYKPYIPLEPDTGNYMNMVMDMDGFVDGRVGDFIRTHARGINERLWEISVTQEKLEALRCTPGIHHTTRAIARCIEEDMKTVTLHLDKEGRQLAIKYEARMLRCANITDYSGWHMDAPGRRAFEATFGKRARLYPADIEKITYGKKTLYEREEGGR